MTLQRDVFMASFCLFFERFSIEFRCRQRLFTISYYLNRAMGNCTVHQNLWSEHRNKFRAVISATARGRASSFEFTIDRQAQCQGDFIVLKSQLFNE